MFPPKWLAGIEIASYNMAELLAKRGHEVHVVTSLDEGMPKEGFEKGFYIHRLPKGRVRLAGAFIFSLDMVRMIWKINPDIIHVQSFGIAFPALISKKILHIPYVICGHGTDVYHPDWFTKLILKTIIINADSVIALTEDMKKAMQIIYNRDVSVIPNGINLNEYTERLPIQREASSGKSILFVGRLHPVKGVRFLLYAMQIVHEEIPDARLILVGDGEEREFLENLTDQLGIRGCVDFIGKVSHERIPDYMFQADMFVLPSLSESFGIVNLEAMASGLPIVATRVEGVPDIIEDGVNGYLVEPKNHHELATKIIYVLEDENRAKKISDANKEKVKIYSYEYLINELECLYMKCCNYE